MYRYIPCFVYEIKINIIIIICNYVMLARDSRNETYHCILFRITYMYINNLWVIYNDMIYSMIAIKNYGQIELIVK